MGDFELWYKDLPFVTRTYLTSILVTTTVISLGIISPYSLILNFDHKMEVIFYYFLVIEKLIYYRFGDISLISLFLASLVSILYFRCSLFILEPRNLRDYYLQIATQNFFI
jgi:hypothetical protein